MKIIILEGVATSGKTTLLNKLGQYFQAHGIKYKTVSEEATLMPILENEDKNVSLDLLQGILAEELRGEAEYLIFDRLYFTHVLKTGSTLADFMAVKRVLKEHDCLLVLLTLKEEVIGPRVAASMEHRDASWREFVERKGSPEDIASYYINQQRQLIALARQSSLRVAVYDTTDKQYDEIAEKVLAMSMTLSST